MQTHYAFSFGNDLVFIFRTNEWCRVRSSVPGRPRLTPIRILQIRPHPHRLYASLAGNVFTIFVDDKSLKVYGRNVMIVQLRDPLQQEKQQDTLVLGKICLLQKDQICCRRF